MWRLFHRYGLVCGAMYQPDERVPELGTFRETAGFGPGAVVPTTYTDLPGPVIRKSVMRHGESDEPAPAVVQMCELGRSSGARLAHSQVSEQELPVIKMLLCF